MKLYNNGLENANGQYSQLCIGKEYETNYESIVLDIAHDVNFLSNVNETSKIFYVKIQKPFNTQTMGNVINPSTLFRIFLDKNWMSQLEPFTGEPYPDYINLNQLWYIDCEVIELVNVSLTECTIKVKIDNTKFNPIHIQNGDKVFLGFNIQRRPDTDYPININVYRLSDLDTEVRWDDSTQYRSALKFRIEYKLEDDTIWTYTEVFNKNSTDKSQNKYIISGLQKNSRYVLSVMSFFSNDLKDYSSYAPFIYFNT